MAIAGFSTFSIEGIDLAATYTGYVQSTAQSSTNNPDYPGPTGQFSLGQVAKGTDGSEWVYVLAGTAIAVGDTCLIVNTTTLWTASSITSTLAAAKQGDLVGVAPLVAIASGSYGWVQRSGKCAAISVAAATTANVALKTSTTAGRLTTTLATAVSVQISGIVIAATGPASAGVQQGVLNWPVVSTAD
jgi:hypothetical protein